MQRILCSTAVLALLMGAPALAQETTPKPAGDCSAVGTDSDLCKDKSNNQNNQGSNAGNNNTDSGAANAAAGQVPAAGSTTGAADNDAAQTTVPKTVPGNDNAAQNNNTDNMTTGTTTPSTDSTAATPTAPVDGASTANTAGVATGTQFLASQFIGRTVYSSANENVGEINDLVMNKDLDTIVAIIGVGGFLGIGEKDVAVPIDQITVTADANTGMTDGTTTGTGTGTGTTTDNTTAGVATATPKLTIAMTREQLDKAPAFDRTALAR